MSSPPPRPADRVAPQQADRQLLELHALRQRQLRSAFLHGHRRGWRDRHPIWPAVVAALVIIALLAAAISVLGAFQRQHQLEAGAVSSSATVSLSRYPSSTEDGRCPPE